MRRGHWVKINKAPEHGECLVLDVKYSTQGEGMVLLSTARNEIIWTKARNVEKIEEAY